MKKQTIFIAHETVIVRPLSSNGAKGFTFFELMIVVVIIGILASLATPSYSRYIRRSEVMKMARSYESALNIGLYNAKVSGRSIKVCATNNINANTPACLTDFASFASAGNSDTMGWIVFWDIDDNGTADTTASPAEKLYKRIPFTQRKIRMRRTGGADPTVVLAPRNTTGDSSTVCVYAPYSSYSIPSTCGGANLTTNPLDTNLSEARVTVSGLGKVTFNY